MGHQENSTFLTVDRVLPPLVLILPWFELMIWRPDTARTFLAGQR